MNLRTLRLLEYNKIVEMLTSYAASPMAKRKCERLKPRKDPVLIQTLQQETRCADPAEYTGQPVICRSP